MDQDFNLPVTSALAGSSSILVLGMGGGFDVFCGLPLYLALQQRGFQVHLASVTFSPHAAHIKNGLPLSGTLTGVTANHTGPVVYFPELHLSRWFREARGEEVPIWCFRRTGVAPTLADLRLLHERIEFDAILLVDGGVDSLSRGDEAHMGSVMEDWTTLAAVAELDEVPLRLLACIGLGAECEVTHAHIFENIADLTAAGAFLGTCSLLGASAAGRAYDEAVTFAQSQPHQEPSVINSSILSAVRGHYGNFHLTDKTRKRPIWISPLMSIYWFFDAKAVADRNLVLSQLRWTQTQTEVGKAIIEARYGITCRPVQSIPLP